METLSEKKLQELKNISKKIRISIVEMLSNAGSGHTAGALGMADIFTLLFFHVMHHDPKNPKKENRDRLVLSNGHICPVLYSTMAHCGYFDTKELLTLRKFGSRLQGHPHREFLPFVETSSGPLGSGLSQAVGMAIVDKRYDNYTRKIYAIISDGELDEGNTWEAILLSAKEKLHNLIVIVDRNHIQIGGNTEEVLPLHDLKEKFKSFNMSVEEIDGHDFNQINNALHKAHNSKTGPFVIIAKTIPSKGIKKWEHDYKWHGKAPKAEEAILAIKELEENA